MKAFLLAAGKGTRLQPLTFHTPKCLVPVAGKPLIDYWLELFEIYGINEALINTSHLAEKVRNYLTGRPGKTKIELTYEAELLGSGGTIKKNWDFVKGEDAFYILYADNLTNINLGKMLEFHNKRKRDFTLALFRVPNPKECGIVELDASSMITSFKEKPEQPVSDLAFAGVMVSSAGLKDFFPDKEIFDLGHDVLPHVAGKASGYIMEEYLLDVGTSEKLRRAEEDVRNGILKRTKQEE